MVTTVLSMRICTCNEEHEKDHQSPLLPAYGGGALSLLVEEGCSRCSLRSDASFNDDRLNLMNKPHHI